VFGRFEPIHFIPMPNVDKPCPVDATGDGAVRVGAAINPHFPQRSPAA
jgi:hypothetical protein